MNSLRGGVSAIPGHAVDLVDKRGIYPGVDDSLHHGQMLEIIVGLEEGVAGIELDQDASDTPNVTRVRPAEAENNLWRPVMAG